MRLLMSHLAVPLLCCRLYVEDDSYMLVFPQLMGSTKGGWLLGRKTVAEAATAAFLATWR